MATRMGTYVPKQGEIRRDWWVVDAAGLTLGRLSTAVAFRLMGKHKPSYTPFLDTGDHVVVVNAAKVKLTGRKLDDKMYRWHSNYPGGLKEVPAGKLLARKPEKVVEQAVWGMLPKGPLGRQMVRKLKVYRGSAHPHEAQKPKALEIASARRAER
jgi:large subunit ribosomal protein L13